MKLIKQSYEILEQKDFTLVGIKKFIERCGRVCYKSEDKMTDDSYEKFVNMLEKRDHARPLEFGTVHLRIPEGVWNDMVLALATNYHYSTNWVQAKLHFGEYFITTNYRYYLFLTKIYPEIEKYFTKEDNEYYPKRYTVYMILDRGVMDEFRTHVGLSHLAESTRYCNYSKDKFDNQVTFVIPSWCNSLVEGAEQKYSPFEINGNEVEFMDALQNAQNSYLSLLKLGWMPQQARDVLPLSVKSELISCGFKDAWSNFFYRRCAKDAHPMAQEIAKPMHKEFIERGFIDK
nr:MAG TPA: Thymidylate synthase complementing protein [Bacteriophage sp.]